MLQVFCSILAVIFILLPIILMVIVYNKGCCVKCIDSIKCAHEYKYYNDEGKEDNENPTIAKCVKCGQVINIKE